MMRILPKWYTKAEEELNRLIVQIANKNNIKFSLVADSKTIEKSKEAILMKLVHIQENAYPEIDKEHFEELDKLEKEMRKKK